MDQEETDVSEPVSSAINTYHCICGTLILATNHSLSSLPTRAAPAQDQAIILPLPLKRQSGQLENDQRLSDTSASVLHNTIEDRKLIVVRREDGFEKRILVRCGRCNLVIGYKLDESQFAGMDVRADKILYLLPGGLASTADMKLGNTPAVPEWAKETL